MKGYIDLIISSDETKRIQVEVAKVNPNGSFDYVGDECKGYNTRQTLYNEDGQIIFPLPPHSETELLNAKIKALSDYQDFLEECLVEMAGLVYAG